MADPQPDQGFFPGLLGKVGNWFGSYDPQAAYGGLLSDPEVKQQFRIRELGAVAQSMAANSMPVPYKGGMPWGSFLGAAGGAAATAGDSLMKARLEAAQAGLANQTVEATKTMMPMYQKLFDDANRAAGGGGAAGTGGASTGAPGAPAKGTDITPLARLGTGDTKSTDAILNGPLGDKIRAAAAKYNLDPVMLAAQVNAESSGDPTKIGPANKDGVRPVGLMQLMPDTAKAMGVKDPLDPEQNLDGGAKYLRQGLDASNGDLPNALKFYYSGSTDEKAWGPLTNAYPSRVFALAPKPDQTAAAPGTPAPAASASPSPRSLLDPRGAPLPGGALGPGAEGADAAAPAVPAKQAQVGPYAPVPGQPPPQGVYVPPGGGPAVRIEDGQPVGGGAPPAAAAAAPVKVGGLLDPQGGGETGSPLGRVAGLPPQPGGAPGGPPPEAVAQLAKLASASGGPIVPVAAAAPASAPPAAAAQPAPRSLLDPNAGMEGGPPLPTGAVNPQAGPQGLMTPQATPPPVTSAPAPAAAAPVNMPALPPRPTLPPLPSQMPQITSPQMPQATPGQAAAMGIAGISALIGKPAPEWIQQMAAMPGQQAMETFKSWLGVQTQGMTDRDKANIDIAVKPYMAAIEAAAKAANEPRRPGSATPVFGPDGKQLPGAAGWNITPLAPFSRPGAPDALGNPTTEMVYPSGNPDEPPRIVKIPGASGMGPYASGSATNAATRDAAAADKVTKEGIAANEIAPSVIGARSLLPATPQGFSAGYENAFNQVLVKLGVAPQQADKVGNYTQLATYLAEIHRTMLSGEGGGGELGKAFATPPISPQTAPQALPRLLSDIAGTVDYRRAKLQAQAEWTAPGGQGNGTPSGFEADWNKNISPFAFMLNRMDAPERQQMLARIQAQPGGAAELKQVLQQMTYGRSKGWIPNLEAPQ